MSESEKIAASFEAFYDGQCWIGLNFLEAVKGVDERLAAAKRKASFNTIWQLVNHLIYWRKTVIIRLQGILANPPMPDFYQPEKTSLKAWEETLFHFDEVQKQLVSAIRAFPSADLEKASPMKGQTYYQLLTGCLQHDAYHMGQMVLLKKEK